MSTATIYQLVLAGGSGTRFWPLSRRARPKQLLKLGGEVCLLQRALDRLDGMVEPTKRWVVTTADQVDVSREALPNFGADRFIVEPAARDTAAALGLGAATIARIDPDAVIVAMPADHLIEPTEKFQETIAEGVQLLSTYPEAVVTIGVRPSFAATAYGYIQVGEPVEPADDDNPSAWHVARFREKPNQAAAESFVDAGRFYWNCGIFIWRAQALLEALDRFLPKTADVVRREGSSLAPGYANLEKISIDYAVMERHPQVLMLEAGFSWSDVGSWHAVADFAERDEHNNAVLGCKHVGLDSHGCVVVGTDRLVATVGLDNVVVVDTPDALLVCDRHRTEHVKQLVRKLAEVGREELL